MPAWANEFFIEESFPLDWMFPYLTPFGIIMKINRNPVGEFTQDMCDRDHEFWSQYSDRFIGNWITYDTPVQEICDFAKRVYIKRDFQGFKGRPEFVRDDNAQKSFSKLRGAIGGIYSWRISNNINPAEHSRLVREADFAFKQSFAFCPYSPEAVIRYINFLAAQGRIDDAEKIAETCYAFDPDNLSIRDLVENLKRVKASGGGGAAPLPVTPANSLAEMEEKFAGQSNSAELAFQLASAYLSNGRQDDAIAILEKLIAFPGANSRTILSVAEAFRQLNKIPLMEGALTRYVALQSNSPEAWYDLAAIQAALGKAKPSSENLSRALALSDQRQSTTPNITNDLRRKFPADTRFQAIRGSPEMKSVFK